MSTQMERRRGREARAGARLQGSQHDQENDMLGRLPEQDPEVRKAIRCKYRELKQSIAGADFVL